MPHSKNISLDFVHCINQLSHTQSVEVLLFKYDTKIQYNTIQYSGSGVSKKTNWGLEPGNFLLV